MQKPVTLWHPVGWLCWKIPSRLHSNKNKSFFLFFFLPKGAQNISMNETTDLETRHPHRISSICYVRNFLVVSGGLNWVLVKRVSDSGLVLLLPRLLFFPQPCCPERNLHYCARPLRCSVRHPRESVGGLQVTHGLLPMPCPSLEGEDWHMGAMWQIPLRKKAKLITLARQS